MWDEAIKVALSLFETEGWRDKDQVVVDHALDITLPVRLRPWQRKQLTEWRGRWRSS